jgi:oligoribonuclease
MTGLDLNKDVLVEIAVLVTDSELNILGEGVDLVIRATEEQLKGMNEFVTNMHTESGLITEIPNGVELEKAEAEIIAYLEKYAPGAGKSPLAGNSVGTDRSFIARDMPLLIDQRISTPLVSPDLFRRPKEDRQSSRARRHP